MARMDQPNNSKQLVKLLLIGDSKCGKTDFAGMAAAQGFNVLYLDADVGVQTLVGLPMSARQNIYALSVGDRFDSSGGIEPHFAKFFKDWIAKPKIVWNDSQSRQYDILIDGQVNETDEFNIIYPARMDKNCVLVIDSWTALAQSCMQWAANDMSFDLADIAQDERGRMRTVYQASGEKLTQFLLAIQRAPCHVIVLSHPAEFVKTEKPAGKTIGTIAEKELKVLWTKMTPKSSSGPHALSMAKYFTDVAWMEAKLLGKVNIDFRVDKDRISGSHFNEAFDIERREGDKVSGFQFSDLVRKLGGTIPTENARLDGWLTTQTGYDSTPKQKIGGVTLKANGAQTKVDAPTVQAETVAPKSKGLAGLAKLKTQVSAKP